MVPDIKTKIFLSCLVLFSKELFSDTRLSQLSTGGVQLHIEDWQAGVQRSSWEKKLLKMPNKPNFQMSRLSVTLDMTSTYNANFPKKRKKNKPKTHQKRTKTSQIPNINRIVNALAPIKIINLLTQPRKAINIFDSLFNLTETKILGQGEHYGWCNFTN